MGYQTTQFLFFFRRLSRDEDQPGNLRKMLVAMFISLALVWGWNQISIDGKRLRDFEEPLLLRMLFNLRGDIPAPNEIAIVKVDDLSYQKLNISNRKPFPRAVLADALKEIHRDQPKVVVLDMHAPFDEDEEIGTTKAVEALRLGPSTIARAPITDDASYSSDPRIREAAAMELPMVVDDYFGVTYYIRQSHLKSLPLDESVPLLKPLTTYVKSPISPPDQDALINFYGAPATRVGGETDNARATGATRATGAIRSYSLWQLFADERVIPAGYFKDKVVFLGFASELSMRGFSDKEILEVTAPGGYMYGVEIHATIAGNLLDGSWIRRLDPKIESLALFVILFAMTLGILLLHPLDSLILVVGMFVTWFIGTYIAFVYGRYFFPGIIVAMGSMVVIYDLVITTVATLLQRELAHVKKMVGME